MLCWIWLSRQAFFSCDEITCSLSDWCVHCFIIETHVNHQMLHITFSHVSSATLHQRSLCSAMNQWNAMEKSWSKKLLKQILKIKSRDHASQHNYTEKKYFHMQHLCCVWSVANSAFVSWWRAAQAIKHEEIVNHPHVSLYTNDH